MIMDRWTLPRYVSHKEVGALEIAGLTSVGMIEGVLSYRLEFKDERFASIVIDAKLCSRYEPVAGDFYVIYDDGYESFSPRKAFVEGYKVKA